MEKKKYLIIDNKQTKIEDLTGKKFGKLTVVKFDEDKYKKQKYKYCWLCECDCGNENLISVFSNNLKKKNTLSCGCIHKEAIKSIGDIYYISFYDWCIENNHQNYLDLWDYDLNKKLPNEIGRSSRNSFYFKCENKKHESELRKIINLTTNNGEKYTCIKCNSFAQWGIDNICSDFLEKYWDYDKNVLNPWEISHASNKKVWIKCQDKDYHDSYNTMCNNFYKGKRCSYCSNIKIHKLDSLGTIYPKVFNVWSSKNKKSPYEIAPKSNVFYWFECPNGTHKDYYRGVNTSVNLQFRCPECSCSKGENRISEFLLCNNINYNSQYSFDGLVGINNGLLSYDFYLKDKYNLLIEYQGEQHDHYIEGFHKTYSDFKKQQEHDKRKKQYALDNNIKLLEIWYWNFDNIEEILKQELKIN